MHSDSGWYLMISCARWHTKLLYESFGAVVEDLQAIVSIFSNYMWIMANRLVDICMFVEFIPQNNEFQPQSWRKLYSNSKVKCSCIHRGPESIECIIL